MLVELKRMVAYICPFCSNVSTKIMSVFNFSGTEKVNLICPTHGCHENCVTITQKNSKYKLNIECPLCGGTHMYSIAADTFWNKPLIAYKCPVAGINVFFAGERKNVENALDEFADVYSDVIDDIEDIGDDIKSSPFDIICELIECLNTLMNKGLISCTCGSREIEFDIQDKQVILRCTHCRRIKAFEASEDSLMRVLNSSAIIIGK